VLAGLLAGCGLAVEKWWPVPPGSMAFLLSQIAPVAIAALRGGLWPGILAAALSVGGASVLWGKSFRWDVALAVSGLVAWACSRMANVPARRVMLAWQHTRLADGTLLLWHNGGTGGYASWCGIVREQQIGVVVLSNSANSVDALGDQILASVIELETDAD
jgi:hypothetical protein